MFSSPDQDVEGADSWIHQQTRQPSGAPKWLSVSSGWWEHPRSRGALRRSGTGEPFFVGLTFVGGRRLRGAVTGTSSAGNSADSRPHNARHDEALCRSSSRRHQDCIPDAHQNFSTARQPSEGGTIQSCCSTTAGVGNSPPERLTSDPTRAWRGPTETVSSSVLH